MAAHILTALRQIRDGDTRNMVFHLEHAGWADQLEFEDWTMFLSIAKLESDIAIKIIADYLMDKYYQKWVQVGEPACLEDWIENQSKLRQKERDANV